MTYSPYGSFDLPECGVCGHEMIMTNMCHICLYIVCDDCASCCIRLKRCLIDMACVSCMKDKGLRHKHKPRQ